MITHRDPFCIITDSFGPVRTHSGPIPDPFRVNFGPVLKKFSPAAGSLSGIALSGEQPPAARCAGAKISILDHFGSVRIIPDHSGPVRSHSGPVLKNFHLRWVPYHYNNHEY